MKGWSHLCCKDLKLFCNTKIRLKIQGGKTRIKKKNGNTEGQH